MKKLRISSDLGLPIDVVTQRISILGRTRSGKSHTAGVLVEEVMKAHQQAVVIDPKGDWWGLRSSADGKLAGLDITIFGGKHGDIPLEPTAGALVADIVMNEGISVILDLSLFESKAAEVRFMEAFLDRLYRKNENPILLVVDEGDIFAPQKPEKNETTMLNRMETVCRRGGQRGIGVVLISQRSASIHKGCLSQTELLIAHQTTAPQDRKAIREWAEGKGTEEQQKQLMGRLAALKTGMAVVWSPAWLDLFKEIVVRKKETYDSGATPKVGVKRRAPKILAAVDMERIKKYMSETLEKMKSEDPRLLREEIARLKREIARAKSEAGFATVPDAPAPVKPEIRKITVSAVRESDLKRIDAAIARAEKLFEKSREAGKPIEQAVNGLREAALQLRNADREAKAQAVRKTPLAPFASLGRNALATAARALDRSEKPGNGDLIAGERKMLHVLAQIHPGVLTRAQLGRLSGYTPSGGTFGQYYSRLKREGYVQERMELIDGRSCEVVSLTEQGIGMFPDGLPEGPTTPEERIEFWRERLKGGELKMFDYLVSIFPKAVTVEELGQATGYTSEGGTFGQYLGTLRRNRLVVAEDQGYRASPELFELEASGR